ncbi:MULTISPECIES: hypothetical protein [Pelagibacterium]|uniref:Uncharacterized protein n=1 Tax=Pelagibacterium luteolum TaxID=440168 RepID=A0A1G7WPL3_9HYPH|nr:MULTISPECIES: hypothetical protein [Pelagibacterium]SDG73824.1 hypothetical protein SAMN04487974_10732 [Pelagibacterium luteolum]
MTDLRAIHKQIMERYLLGKLKASQYAVLAAISARTLAWRKVIEVIPLDVFSRGMRDPMDRTEPHFDSYGVPYFSGTGLDKLTVRRALTSLVDQGAISRYEMHTASRKVHAFSPISQKCLVAIFDRNQVPWPNALPSVEFASESLSELECFIVQRFFKVTFENTQTPV